MKVRLVSYVSTDRYIPWGYIPGIVLTRADLRWCHDPILYWALWEQPSINLEGSCAVRWTDFYPVGVGVNRFMY